MESSARSARMAANSRWKSISLRWRLSMGSSYPPQSATSANANATRRNLITWPTTTELTELPNRILLRDRLGQALLNADRHRRQVAVLFLDLDNFKFINDSLGHDRGDRLLKIFAERMTASVRASDTVARQGSDNFVIVLPDLAKSEDAFHAGPKNTDRRQPAPRNRHSDLTEISCCIGICIHPKDGKDVKTLLEKAELAVARAKEQGPRALQFFTDELNNRVVDRHDHGKMPAPSLGE